MTPGATATPPATFLRIGRHILASNASSFDTAWRTFGWTPDVTAERASRLEEQVPWATRAAAASAPAMLAGDAADILDPHNSDRLDYAFQRLDGRLAFSIWGAIGEQRSSAGEWRVATHTVLLTDEDFRAIGGFPFGLMHDHDVPTRPAAWLRDFAASRLDVPGPLDPIEIEATAELAHNMEQARLAEIVRLRDRLRDRWGADLLEERLASVLEALSRVRRTAGLRHVAIREGSDRSESLLARLAWLSMPINDRAVETFTTEHRKAQHARASLLVLPAEWGGFVPEGALLVDRRPRDGVGDGRAFWSATITRDDPIATLPALERRAAARNISIMDEHAFAGQAEIVKWTREWRTRGPGPELAGRLLELEITKRSSPRSRALGHVVGRAAAAIDDSMAAADWVLSLLEEPANGRTSYAKLDRVRFSRAVIRTLGRTPGSASAAFTIRCAVVRTGDVPPEELLRLRGPELRLLHACPDPHRNPNELLAALQPLWLHDPIAVSRLLDSVGRACGPTYARNLAAELFQRVAPTTPEPMPTTIAEGLLRLLWIQPDAGARIAESFLVSHRDRAILTLARLLGSPAPLPTFLAIRRLLLERALPGACHNAADAAATVQPYSPLLADHLVGDRHPVAAAQPRRSN